METNDNVIFVKRGENFTIKLEAVPTAGYHWQLQLR